MRLASVVVVGLATPAMADPPRVDLTRCTAFDGQALLHAIARELPTDTNAHPFAVIVACPDLVTANLHVEPVPADGPIARSLDLGEVPGDLRIKLLALAIAELAEVAASLPAPPTTVATAPTRPRVYADPRDPQSLSDANPKAARRRTTLTPAPTPPEQHDRVATTDDVGSDSITTSAHPVTARPPIELGPIVGVRVFGSTRTTVMPDLGAELSLPWFRVGVRGAVGRARDPLGTVYPWIATATAARELVCIGPGCALVRAEAGMAGVVARANPTTATAANASSVYAQGSLGIEVQHRFAGWSAAATIDAGYAAGMVAHAEGRAVTSLGGFVTTAGVGARWR